MTEQSSLTVRRDHLADNRRMIIGRSLAASMAGLVPVPMFDDWVSSTIKRGTIRKIADSRGVDVSEEGVRALADGTTSPPEWTELAGGALIYKLVTRTWRKVLIAYLATRRAQAASRYFVMGTMFDHYCARVHVGMGLDGDTAAELRSLMEQAIEITPGGISSRAFRRGAIATVRASIRAPIELLDVASGGALRRLLTRGSDEVEAIEEVDSAIDAELSSQRSFLARSVQAIELQLSADENPYIDELIATFEGMWRARRSASDEPFGD